jgi:hypothetical protein
MVVVQRRSDRRFVRPLAWLALLIVVGMVLPPFHVRRLAQHPAPAAGHASPEVALDVQSFARKLWNDQLVPANRQAIEVATLASALTHDVEAATLHYGRRAGLGGNALFLVRGSGRVTSVDRRGVHVSIGKGIEFPVLMVTGPIFGNLLRDGSGLLNARDFSSFDFNALSAELNAIAETDVQPALKRAVAGTMLGFFGSAEVTGDPGQLQMTVVPIIIEYPK